LVHYPLSSVPALHLVLARPDPVLGGDVRIWIQTFVIDQAAIVDGGRELGRVLDVAPAAQVPLANMERRVPGLVQRTRQGRGLRVEEVGHLTRLVSRAGLEITGDPPPRRELPREDAAA